MCDGGVFDVFVLEHGCVLQLLSIVIIYSADVVLVVFWGILELPSVDSVIFPGGACVGFLMYEYRKSHWAKIHYVVVEGSKHFRIGRCVGCCI